MAFTYDPVGGGAGSSLVITSQATAEAGVNNTEVMSPLRTAQAIAAQPAAFPSAGGTFVDNVTFDEVTETVHAMTTLAVDAANGSVQTRSLVASETPTFSLNAGQAVRVTYVPATFDLTWTNVNKWTTGAAPAVLEAEHVFVFYKDGAVVVGHSVGGIS